MRGHGDQGVLLRARSFPGPRPLRSPDEEGAQPRLLTAAEAHSAHATHVTGLQPGRAPRSIREQGADCLGPRGTWLVAGSLSPEEAPFQGDVSYFSMEGPPQGAGRGLCRGLGPCELCAVAWRTREETETGGRCQAGTR